MRPGLCIATLGGVISAATLAYYRRCRPHVLDWGATSEEAHARLPGDDLITDVAIQTTRAMTVDAAPEAIWPWLVQMGPRPRAGAYTYDWLERLLGIDIENSNCVLPQFQHLEPGQFLALSPGSENGLTVKQVEPNRALVLQWTQARSTWSFFLAPQPDGTTRLVSRNRIPGSGACFWLNMVLFMEPASLLMERKMLLGIKQRAQSLARPTANLYPSAPIEGPPSAG